MTKWLFHQNDVNLTVTRKAGEWDNAVLQVELMIPNKTDVLPYVDGDSEPPVRYAHVVLDLRATQQPTYTEILVGPLPISNATGWQPLEYPHTKKTGGSIRNLDADDVSQYEFLFGVASTIKDITLDLRNATAGPNRTLDVWVMFD